MKFQALERLKFQNKQWFKLLFLFFVKYKCLQVINNLFCYAIIYVSYFFLSDCLALDLEDSLIHTYYTALASPSKKKTSLDESRRTGKPCNLSNTKVKACATIPSLFFILSGKVLIWMKNCDLWTPTVYVLRSSRSAIQLKLPMPKITQMRPCLTVGLNKKLQRRRGQRWKNACQWVKMQDYGPHLKYCSAHATLNGGRSTYLCEISAIHRSPSYMLRISDKL